MRTVFVPDPVHDDCVLEMKLLSASEHWECQALTTGLSLQAQYRNIVKSGENIPMFKPEGKFYDNLEQADLRNVDPSHMARMIGEVMTMSRMSEEELGNLKLPSSLPSTAGPSPAATASA